MENVHREVAVICLESIEIRSEVNVLWTLVITNAVVKNITCWKRYLVKNRNSLKRVNVTREVDSMCTAKQNRALHKQQDNGKSLAMTVISCLAYFLSLHGLCKVFCPSSSTWRIAKGHYLFCSLLVLSLLPALLHFIPGEALCIGTINPVKKACTYKPHNTLNYFVRTGGLLYLTTDASGFHIGCLKYTTMYLTSVMVKVGTKCWGPLTDDSITFIDNHHSIWYAKLFCQVETIAKAIKDRSNH